MGFCRSGRLRKAGALVPRLEYLGGYPKMDQRPEVGIPITPAGPIPPTPDVLCLSRMERS